MNVPLPSFMEITCWQKQYFIYRLKCRISGPGCSKLTTSLVNNVLLKFQRLISQICQYFLLKKCEKLLHCKSSSHFSTKTISLFGYKVLKHLTSWPLNELVKLTMLWTTGPWCTVSGSHCKLSPQSAKKRDIKMYIYKILKMFHQSYIIPRIWKFQV